MTDKIDWIKRAQENRDEDGCEVGITTNADIVAGFRLTGNPRQAEKEWNTPTPQRRETPKFRSRQQCRDRPKPQWIIPGLVQEGSNIAIYAPSGFLKSFVAIDIALSLATGLPVFGTLPVAKTGGVFYAAGEGQRNVEDKRMTAWELSHGFEAFSLPNVWTGGSFIVNDEDAIKADISEIRGSLAIAAFIDTKAIALNGLDEDKSHTASRYFNFLAKLKAETGISTTVTIGHFGKELSRLERGSSAFRAGFDTIFHVRNLNKDDETGCHTLELYISKQKDAEDGTVFYLRTELITLPDGETSLVLRSMTETEAMDNKSKSGVSTDLVEKTLAKIAPQGTAVGKRQLAKAIQENLTTRMSIDGIEKALDRGKEKKFSLFVTPEGLWRLPFGRQIDESFAQQIASLKAEGKMN